MKNTSFLKVITYQIHQTLYIKSQTIDRIVIEVIEKETGKLLSTGVFKGNSYTSYSCEGLDREKEYDMAISKQESLSKDESEASGSIIIF